MTDDSDKSSQGLDAGAAGPRRRWRIGAAVGAVVLVSLVGLGLLFVNAKSDPKYDAFDVCTKFVRDELPAYLKGAVQFPDVFKSNSGVKFGGSGADWHVTAPYSFRDRPDLIWLHCATHRVSGSNWRLVRLAIDGDLVYANGGFTNGHPIGASTMSTGGPTTSVTKSSVPPPAPPVLDAAGFPDDVVFQDASNGWGVAAACDTDFQPSILTTLREPCAFQAVVTTDGGRTWHTRGSEHRFEYAMKNPSDGATIGAVVADAQTAWLTGGHSEVTRDGGLSWTVEPLPGYVSVIDPVKGGAWALAGACSSGNCTPTLYRLGTDQRWSGSPVQPPGENAGSQLTAVSASTAYVFSGSTSEFNQTLLVRTTDGGQHWQQLPFPCSLGGGQNLVAVDTARLWLFCGDQPTSSDETGQLYRSTDGALHWTLVADTVRPEIIDPTRHQIGNMPIGGYLPQIYALPTGEVYMTREKFGLVARSTDGGTTWVTVLGDDGAGTGYQRPIALDNAVVWVQSGSCLWRTVNSGQHWTLMNNRTGYACGNPPPQGAQ
jgi:hypothetical protein